MKAPKFDYERAESVAHALQLLKAAGPDARIIAGGQSLVPALNARMAAPNVLIDIGALDELRGVALHGDRLRIGALTRHADIMRSPLIARHAPLMAEAVHHIAHPAIRNRGTLGGSLALADPAAEWPACVTALKATIVIAGPNGERRVAAEDFFQGVYTVDLEPDELLVAVEAPVAAADDRFAFDEIARRRGDFALVGLAISWRMGAGSCLRLVFLGVGDRPEPVDFGGVDLVARLRAGGLDAVVDDAVAGLDPSADPYVSTEYRLHLARVLCARMIKAMIEGLA